MEGKGGEEKRGGREGRDGAAVLLIVIYKQRKKT